MITHDQLIAYVSSALAPEERVRLEEQLAGDEAALRSLLEQERLDAALRMMFGAAAEREQLKRAILDVVAGPSYQDVKSSVMQVIAAPRFVFRDWLAGWRGILAGGLAVAACLTLALWVRFAAPLPDAAHLANVTGGVSIVRGGGKQDAVAGFVLQAGDELRVAAKASVAVVYADATRLEFTEGTRAAFSEKPEDGKQFELALGQVVARVSKQSPGKPLRIRTPHATATVVGTEFDLRVSTRGTRLNVSNGLVQLAYVGGDKPMLVAAGDFVEIAPGAKTPVPYGDQPRDQNTVFLSPDVATLTGVLGSVSVVRNGESQTVAEGFTAQPGDRFSIGAQSEAVLVYPDKSRLELKPGSRLFFHAGPEEGKQLGFELGTVIGCVSKQPPSKPLRIRTPHATVTMAGAVFDARVSTRGTRLDVSEGSAQIAWDGEEHSIAIEAGQFIELELLSNKTLTIHRRGSTAHPPPAPLSGGPGQ
ncbi:MAG: FecR domain-containing protein [Verrucomicrobia bacterium]|nr:FecR domain-containing protein [Verrucomicrobiota bacterium]